MYPCGREGNSEVVWYKSAAWERYLMISWTSARAQLLGSLVSGQKTLSSIPSWRCNDVFDSPSLRSIKILICKFEELQHAHLRGSIPDSSFLRTRIRKLLLTHRVIDLPPLRICHVTFVTYQFLLGPSMTEKQRASYHPRIMIINQDPCFQFLELPNLASFWQHFFQ